MVYGPGASATTRYVDLMVGLEVEDGDHEGPVAKQQQQREFSNTDRDPLLSLQLCTSMYRRLYDVRCDTPLTRFSYCQTSISRQDKR